MQARKGANARANLAKRDQQKLLAELNRPHVILGHKPGDENKWKNCDLAKVLVTEESIQSNPPLPFRSEVDDKVPIPKDTNFGIGSYEKELLFETLPAMSTEAYHLQAQHKQKRPLTPSELVRTEEKYAPVESLKATMLARIVDLRNANAKGIAYENRRRCIQSFSSTGSLRDTGRPEVQGTLGHCRSSHSTKLTYARQPPY